MATMMNSFCQDEVSVSLARCEMFNSDGERLANDELQCCGKPKVLALLLAYEANEIQGNASEETEYFLSVIVMLTVSQQRVLVGCLVFHLVNLPLGSGYCLIHCHGIVDR